MLCAVLLSDVNECEYGRGGVGPSQQIHIIRMEVSPLLPHRSLAHIRCNTNSFTFEKVRAKKKLNKCHFDKSVINMLR